MAWVLDRHPTPIRLPRIQELMSTCLIFRPHVSFHGDLTCISLRDKICQEFEIIKTYFLKDNDYHDSSLI